MQDKKDKRKVRKDQPELCLAKVVLAPRFMGAFRQKSKEASA